MPKSKLVLYCAAALSIPVLLVATTPAPAQKKQKISYEEAFKRCKTFIDKEKGGLAHSTTNELTRTSRGAACMRKFGHKL
jgi:hypothetical protein